MMMRRERVRGAERLILSRDTTRTLQRIVNQEGEAPVTGTSVGRYELVRELGRGGMGVVYEARDPRRDRSVAIKVVKLDGTPGLRPLALNEARIMARITHPNTVFIYEAAPTDFGLLLIMEYVDGGTVADLIDQERRIAVERAIRIVLQLVNGLSALDARGLIHRDIKPSNCFLGSDGRAKVGDLGLARSVKFSDESRSVMRFVGTPTYSSPEQLRGEELDRRSDMYSLGATLYEMLSGKAPFEAETFHSLVESVHKNSPKSICQLVPEVPSGLATIVHRMLARNPEDRFVSYDQLAEALLPYSGRALTAGGLLARYAGYLVDGLVLYGVSTLLLKLAASVFSPLGSGISNRIWYWCIGLLYYGIYEGTKGATFGRKIAGLGVVDDHGAPPSLGRAFTRALLFFGPAIVLLPVISSLFPGLITRDAKNVTLWCVFLILFSRIRKLNGYRGLHEKLSRTRVVWAGDRVWFKEFRHWLRQRWPARPQGATPSENREKEAQRIGPNFQVRTDPMLQRKLWVFTGTSAKYLGMRARRDLERPTRLRWVGEGRAERGQWVAFEAPAFRTTLLEMSPNQRKMTWLRARAVLSAVSCELLAGRQDGTLPGTLSLARLLVSAEGGVILLEELLGDATPDGIDEFAGDEAGVLSFLRVLIACLRTGRIVSPAVAAKKFDASLWPVRHQDLLRRLWNDDVDLDDLLAAMSRIQAEPQRGMEELTRKDRSGELLVVAALGAVPLALGGIVYRDMGDERMLVVAGFLGILQSLPALFLQSGVALRLEGIAVRRLDGSRASRGRCFFRALLLWLPLNLLLGHVLGAGSMRLAVALGVVASVGICHAILHPSRSVLDLALGTQLVPE